MQSWVGSWLGEVQVYMRGFRYRNFEKSLKI
jgi:hypothetical protein